MSLGAPVPSDSMIPDKLLILFAIALYSRVPGSFSRPIVAASTPYVSATSASVSPASMRPNGGAAMHEIVFARATALPLRRP